MEILKKFKIESIIFSIFLCIITFPLLDTVIMPGLDSSYLYALNYLFAFKFEVLKNIRFLYGPFGFLYHPLPVKNNLLYGILFNFILRFIVSFYLFELIKIKKANLKLGVIIIWLLLLILDLPTLFYSLIVSLILIYEENKNTKNIIIASFVSVFGLFIKYNIGIMSFLFIGVYLIYDLIKTKKIKFSLYIISLAVISIVLLWLILFKTTNGLFSSIQDFLISGSGNSSALSLNPKNNWILLIFFFLCFILTPILNNTKESKFLLFIFILPLFLTFKYAFAREDHCHVIYLYYFILFFIFIFFIYVKPIKNYIIILLFLLPILLYKNIMSLNKESDIDDRIHLMGINNFTKSIFKYNEFKQEQIKESQRFLKKVMISDSVKKLIKNSTIDCYPFQLSYAIFNNLNYTPRPVFSGGSLYLPYKIDKENADFIESDKSTNFIIWTSGLNGIDTRYDLNTEPLTVLSLLKNYTIIYNDSNFHLLKRIDNTNISNSNIVKSENAEFNNWITVPAIIGIIKAKIEFKRTLLGSLKTSFYKEEEYYIEYLLKSGLIKKHRFSFDNSASGLWISPYLNDINNELKGEEVSKIRFSHADKDFLIHKSFIVNWELIIVNNVK